MRAAEPLKALHWHSNAIKALPHDNNSTRSEYWRLISGLRGEELNDNEGALQASHEAILADPNDFWSMMAHIAVLNDTLRYQDVMDHLEKLEKDTPKSGEESFIVKLLLKVFIHSKIAMAAQAVGKLDSAIQIFKTTISAAERTGNLNCVACQLYQLAFAYFRFGNDEETAMNTWETVLNAKTDENAEDFWRVEHFVEETFTALSIIYYAKAAAAEKRQGDSSFWVAKLEVLSKQNRGTNRRDEVISTRECSSVLGVWYRGHGWLKEAKACFEPKILEGIAMLTDNDMGNDENGYYTLAETLLRARDIGNATAAFAAILSPLNKLKASWMKKQAGKKMATLQAERVNDVSAESANDPSATTEALVRISETPDESLTASYSALTSQPSAKAEETNPGQMYPELEAADTEDDNLKVLQGLERFVFRCDGLCRRNARDYKTLHHCEICPGSIFFCDQYIELVKTKKLSFRICDAEHKFYQIYPYDKTLDGVATVSIDGKMKPRVEWLEGLKKAWSD